MTTHDGDIRRLAAVHVAGLLKRPGLNQLIELARRSVDPKPQPAPLDEPAQRDDQDLTSTYQ